MVSGAGEGTVWWGGNLRHRVGGRGCVNKVCNVEVRTVERERVLGGVAAPHTSVAKSLSWSEELAFRGRRFSDWGVA